MHGYLGHCFNYQKSVNSASIINGWECRVAIPEDSRFDKKPDGWEKCLMPKVPGSFFRKAIKVASYIFRIYKYLRRQTRFYKGKEKIIFLESFYTFQLAAILLSTLFISRRNISVWLLFRHSTPQLHPYELIYKWMIYVFYALFKGRIVMLTDSDLLRISLSGFFKKDFYALPIPHTGSIIDASPYHKVDDALLIWWPGDPRPEKGLDIVRAMLNTPYHGERKVRFILSEDTPLNAVAVQYDVVKLDSHLSPEQYKKWLLMSDIVLLPYDREVYSEGTSGIFVESIVAGKLPLVTSGTWMEYELKKYDLSELAISWTNIGAILPRAEELRESGIVRKKLAEMRRGYTQFHNEKSFASSMLALR
jgi:hypothetical protein